MLHGQFGRIVQTALACFCVLALAGCLAGQEGTVEVGTSTSTPAAEEPSEQPVSPLQPTSPLAGEPAATEPQPFTIDIPEPDADTGIVIGRVITGTETARFWLAGQFLLAEVIYSEGEIVRPMLSVSVGDAPEPDIRNDVGEFAFFDVEPGQYGFVIYTPLTSYVVPDETKESVLFFDVLPGQVLDLGVIVVE